MSIGRHVESRRGSASVEMTKYRARRNSGAILFSNPDVLIQ
jgi:hypothetical protein